MGQGLLQAGERNPTQHRDQAIEHGEQRWDNGWSLTELVRDYQILQLVIVEHLATVLDRPIGFREAMAVGVFINDAIAASIAAYVANRDHHARESERAALTTLRETQARKDAFLAMVVHEIRNPVAPILYSASTLQQVVDGTSPRAREAADLIERQSRHLLRLLDDLTDLTRMAQGRLTLRRAPVDVTDVIDQAIKATAHLVLDRGHRLTSDLGRGPLVIDGDSDRLVQVVVNLITNAVKYTQPGGLITVAAERTGDTIRLEVTDDGPGIPPESRERVFELYVRAGEGCGTEADGLGIGLALVKRIIELHGGTVTASSREPHTGAVFTIQLPATGTTIPWGATGKP